MIINTGGRTDTVQYYAKWLLKRFEEGYVLSRNPLFPNKVSRYELTPEKVDCIQFCSKNYEPILTMNLGPVHITDHARRRYRMYIERANNDENSLKNPLKSLIDRLSNKSLVRETLPDRVLKHKLKKYKIDFFIVKKRLHRMRIDEAPNIIIR